MKIINNNKSHSLRAKGGPNFGTLKFKNITPEAYQGFLNDLQSIPVAKNLYEADYDIGTQGVMPYSDRIIGTYQDAIHRHQIMNKEVEQDACLVSLFANSAFVTAKDAKTESKIKSAMAKKLYRPVEIEPNS